MYAEANVMMVESRISIFKICISLQKYVCSANECILVWALIFNGTIEIVKKSRKLSNTMSQSVTIIMYCLLWYTHIETKQNG